MACNCCQQEILEILGYSLWVPLSDGYSIGAVVINPGNSNLYLSVSDNNTTIPAQPNAQWALTTVAQLINNANDTNLLWPEWVSGGGIAGEYIAGQAVRHEGGNWIALINTGYEPGTEGSGWQSFGMNSPD